MYVKHVLLINYKQMKNMFRITNKLRQVTIQPSPMSEQMYLGLDTCISICVK